MTAVMDMATPDPEQTIAALREALAVAERRAAELEAVIESIPDALYIGTPEGITRCNANALRQLGASSLADLQAGIGKLGSRFNIRRLDGTPVPPDELSFAKALRGEVAVEEVVATNAQTGEDVYIRGASAPVVLNGQVIGAVAVNTDVTERRRVEEARRQLLESERAARNEAERVSRVKDEFVATLSHELRTPLNAILGWAQILHQKKDHPETLERGLQVIERNARMQAQMISDLLDMSRIISGKIRLDVEPLDLGAVVENAVESVRLAAEAKGIHLEKELDPDGVRLPGDAGRLQQVVWNLLSNAIKFTPRDGRVSVGLSRVNGHAEVTVRDTGQGIRPEFLPYLFERFRQADASTTRQHGGLGLGLSIVKQLVELHGGTIRVESPGEGEGTTFTITLPLTATYRPIPEEVRDQPAEAAPRVPRHVSQHLRGVRVLVVDDQLDAREMVRRLLEECDAEVRTAGGTAEALGVLRQWTPDLLVSDLGMPGQDGYELVRELRTFAPDQGGDLPALALSALARDEDRRRAFEAGYQIHLAKPLEPNELIVAVARLAGRAAEP